MSITPDQLRQLRFPAARKGYDTASVDHAIDAIADALDGLLEERQQLLDRIRGLETEARDALTMAERGAAQMKAEAEAEARQLIAEAQSLAAVRPETLPLELLGELRAVRGLLQQALERLS